ncbi:MAG: tetratricopeptide repeat protein [Planctomycetota bacterium]|jgi:tetratricopeptide (TPR) repeat protein
MKIPCTQIQELIIDWLLGELDPQKIESVQQHLNSCSVCQSYDERLRNQEKELEKMGTHITHNLEEKQDKAIEAIHTLPDIKSTARPWLMKYAAAAAVLLIIVLTVVNKSTSKAWAIGQTIDAFKEIRTVQLECYAAGFGNYDGYLRRIGDDWTSFHCLGEKADGKLFGLFEGYRYYWYVAGSHSIYQINLSEDDFTKSEYSSTKLYSEALKLAPSILPHAKTLFQIFKMLASEWEETHKIDEQTGRESVFVTCRYKPLSMSFESVFDIETKLVVRAKVWENSTFEGEPDLVINKIVYNIEIEDERFDFEKRFNAHIVPPSEYAKANQLLRKGLQLEEEEENPEEVIAAWQELYERYPDYWQTPDALNMTGCIYKSQKQYDKAIACHQIVLDEYTYPDWAISDAYYNIGDCYKEMGETNKAVKSFEKCLEIVRNKPEPVEPEFLERHQAYIKRLETTLNELKESD